MRRQNRPRVFLSGLTLMIGMIVGAGMFAIPYVGAGTGFTAAAVLLFGLAWVVTRLHLAYSEVVLATPGRHRMIGYAARYLGRSGRSLATLTTVISMGAALLAYGILGGRFLNILLPQVFNDSSFFWGLVFFALGISAIALGLKVIVALEFLFSALLVGVILVMGGVALPRIDGINLTGFDQNGLLMAYGVIFFALSGAAAVPELVDYFKSARLKPGELRRMLRQSISIGTLVPAVLYLIFLLAVLGTSGLFTTDDAITGFGQAVGDWIMILGAVLGLAAVFTSFMLVGENFFHVFRYDMQFKRWLAGLVALGGPVALYVAGAQSHVAASGFAGTVAGSLEGLLILAMHARVRPRAHAIERVAIAAVLLIALFYAVKSLS